MWRMMGCGDGMKGDGGWMRMRDKGGGDVGVGVVYEMIKNKKMLR